AERGSRVAARSIDPFRVAPAHGNARALRGQQARGREADPGGRARDEADAATEPQIHRISLDRMTTLLLVRHGETDWNRDGRWQGHSDTHLNDAGRDQARRVAHELHDVDVAYSSDLARARETAEIIADVLGVPVRLDARLRERSFGAWE